MMSSTGVKDLSNMAGALGVRTMALKWAKTSDEAMKAQFLREWSRLQGSHNISMTFPRSNNLIRLANLLGLELLKI